MILIVDDNETVRLSLSLLLKRAGHDVAAVATPDEAITAARSEASLRLAVIDMNFSTTTDGRQGLELLQRLKVLRPEMPVILITAWGSIPLAVEGMRLGACDFITKPWVNRVMLQRVETALALAAPKADVSCGDFDASGIIGSDTALASVLRTAARIASTNASVLILGENGTGKELIAQAIHRNSPRRDGPFVMVNLGGISRSLFESEMFGHAKGAFTGAVADRKGRFELADKGTIFLDEIGDLDAGSQVKLLRVLQEHTFERLGDSTPRQSDFRLIAATNADLQAMVADGRFREDLFYRINLIVLRLPPLRERSTTSDLSPHTSPRKLPRPWASRRRRLHPMPSHGCVHSPGPAIYASFATWLSALCFLPRRRASTPTISALPRQWPAKRSNPTARIPRPHPQVSTIPSDAP